MATQTQASPRPYYKRRLTFGRMSPYISVSLVGMAIMLLFLAPLGYMTLTAFKTLEQVRDAYSQGLPRSPINFTYEGKEYPLYNVPTEDGTRELALVKPGREASEWMDPQNPEAGLETIQGRWRTMVPVYALNPTYDNFAISYNQINLGRLFRNTLFIALAGTVGTLISSVLVAYGFARFRIPGISVIFIILISTIILPRQVTLIPTYIFFRTIGWGGTWWPLIVPHFFANAYNVFLLRQYFKGIPRDMDEAAMLDGASPWQVLWHVILPQSIPAIIAVGLFHFFYAWNDFFEPLIYLQGREDLYTISIGMTQFNNIFVTQPGLAMAASMMAIALPILLFILSQKVFIQGIVITGVEK